VAFEHIEANLEMVYQEPRLTIFSTTAKEPDLPSLKKAQARDDEERELFLKLSQYFINTDGNWSRRPLLAKCKD
jgi:hypothetical protein